MQQLHVLRQKHQRHRSVEDKFSLGRDGVVRIQTNVIVEMAFSQHSVLSYVSA